MVVRRVDCLVEQLVGHLVALKVGKLAGQKVVHLAAK